MKTLGEVAQEVFNQHRGRGGDQNDLPAYEETASAVVKEFLKRAMDQVERLNPTKKQTHENDK